MSPRPHLLLIRRSRTVGEAEGYFSASVRRYVFRVSILPYGWIQERFPSFTVDRDSSSMYCYALEVPVAPQLRSVHQHFTNLFSQKFASCPRVRIYP